MSYQPVSGIVPQYSDDSNQLASGFYLKFYEANTTTPLSMATDSTGNTLLVKCKLNPDGLPISNPLDNETVFIPHVNQNYRLVVYRTEAHANDDNTAAAFLNVPSLAPLQSINITTATGTQTVAEGLDDRVIKVQNVAAAIALSADIGVVIETNSYAGSGGGNKYEVVAGGTGTADGGFLIDMDNGNQLKGLFPGPTISPAQWGAGVGDDDTEQWRSMAAYIQSVGGASIKSHKTTYNLFTKAQYPDWSLVSADDRIIYEFENLDIFDFDLGGSTVASDRDYEGDETESWVFFRFKYSKNIAIYNAINDYLPMNFADLEQAGPRWIECIGENENISIHDISGTGVGLLLLCNGRDTEITPIYALRRIRHIKIWNVNLDRPHKPFVFAFGCYDIDVNYSVDGPYRAIQSYGCERIRGDIYVTGMKTGCFRFNAYYETGGAAQVGNEAVMLGVRDMKLNIRTDGTADASAVAAAGIVEITYEGAGDSSSNFGVYEDIEITLNDANGQNNSAFENAFLVRSISDLADSGSTETVARGHVWRNIRFKGRVGSGRRVLNDLAAPTFEGDFIEYYTVGPFIGEASLSSRFTMLGGMTGPVKMEGVVLPGNQWAVRNNPIAVKVIGSDFDVGQINDELIVYENTTVRGFALSNVDFLGKEFINSKVVVSDQVLLNSYGKRVAHQSDSGLGGVASTALTVRLASVGADIAPVDRNFQKQIIPFSVGYSRSGGTRGYIKGEMVIGRTGLSGTTLDFAKELTQTHYADPFNGGGSASVAFSVSSGDIVATVTDDASSDLSSAGVFIELG